MPPTPDANLPHTLHGGANGAEIVSLARGSGEEAGEAGGSAGKSGAKKHLSFAELIKAQGPPGKASQSAWYTRRNPRFGGFLGGRAPGGQQGGEGVPGAGRRGAGVGGAAGALRTHHYEVEGGGNSSIFFCRQQNRT